MSGRAAGRLAAAVAAVLVAPGCGAERRTPPDVAAPAPAESFDTLARPAAGLRVALPAAWTTVGRPAPLVAVSRSGSATIALWRYERTEPLPRGADELAAARRRLVEAARVRDPTFAVRRTRALRVDGAPAVQVVGDATIDGRRRRVRSTHVFTDGAELVLDAYAAPEHFAAADAAFRRVVRSVRLS